VRGLMFISTLLAIGLLSGCSGGDTKDHASPKQSSEHPSSSSPATSSSSTTAPTCNKSSAHNARILTIKNGQFDASCLTLKRKPQFFIVNDDQRKYTVQTSGSAPEQFSVDLPKRRSTYAWSPNKPGTYNILAKPGDSKATILVQP
jgi:hypothetical protein